MPFVEQLLQLLDPLRQLGAAFTMEQPTHLPELLLRMTHVQHQRRATAAPAAAPGRSRRRRRSAPAWRSRGGPGRVACARAHSSADFREPNVPNTFLLIGPCSRPSASPRNVDITTSVARGRSCSCPPSSAASSGPVAAAAPGPDAADTCSSAGGSRGRRRAQFLLGGRGDRLAVDLDDQYVAIILGQWTCDRIDISGPGQPRTHSSIAEAGGAAPRNISPNLLAIWKLNRVANRSEPADEQRAVRVAGQPQRHVQGVDTVPAAAARHEERPDVGGRPATGLEGRPAAGSATR